MRILKANGCDWDILSVEDYTNLHKILDPLVREKAKKLFDLHRNTMNGIRTPYYLEIYDQKQEDPTTMITSHRKMLKGKKVRVRIDRHPTPRRHIEYLRTIYSNILNEDKTITNKMCRESDRLLRDGLIMDASRPSYRPNDM
jgi:hypothetical protein